MEVEILSSKHNSGLIVNLVYKYEIMSFVALNIYMLDLDAPYAHPFV